MIQHRPLRRAAQRDQVIKSKALAQPCRFGQHAARLGIKEVNAVLNRIMHTLRQAYIL